MKVFIVLAAFLAVAIAQYAIDESPKPYSFSYKAEGDEGSSSHSETADGSGTVRGSYTLNDIDGRSRIVEYIAGPDGFNANIRTNEPGTDNVAPADVTIESTAEEARRYDAAPRPEARPVAPSASRGGSRGGSRFVLVPADDPRARAYYSGNN